MPGISGSAVIEKRNKTCFNKSSSSFISIHLYIILHLCIQLVPSCSYHLYPSGLPDGSPCLSVGAHQRLFLWWTLQQSTGIKTSPIHETSRNLLNPPWIGRPTVRSQRMVLAKDALAKRWNQRNLCATIDIRQWDCIMRYNKSVWDNMTFHVPTISVVSIRDVTIYKL